MVQYDVKALLLTFGEEGRTSHKEIDRNSIVSVLQSPIIQERMRDGKLLGLLTHDGRERARSNPKLTHTDSVLKDPDLCNILRKITVDGDKLYGYFDLTETDAAKRFKSLIKQGCKIDVSISTELVEGYDKFYIKDFYGVDFTMRPEFSSNIMEVNFSEGYNSIKKETRFDFDFSERPSEQVLVSDNKTSEGDFSVRAFLRERTRKPAIVLKMRILETQRYMIMARASVVKKNASFLRKYILDYINEWILTVLNDEKEDFNLIIGLRLTQYCKDRTSIRELQRNLNRAKSQLRTNGIMSRDVQLNLNKAFQKVLGEIFNYINEKVKNPEKKI